MSNNNSNSGGIGFAGLLFLVFLVLKLCKVIDWSWWWITSPLWAPLAIAVIILPFYFCLKYLEEKEKNKYRMTKSSWQQRIEQMQEAKKLRGED